jgi:hypothetical protein
MNKKGMGGKVVGIIITLTIGFILLIWILGFSKGGLDKLFTGLGDKIEDLEDCDQDGAANMFDKCPCTETGISEHDDLTGCPASFDEEKQKKDKKECTSQKCDQLQGNAPAGQPTAQTR